LSYRGTGFSSGGFLGFPPAVSQIVLANVVVFLVQMLTADMLINSGLPLVPAQAAKGMIWQLVTYMFMHGSFMHLFFNMFAVVIFGSSLEQWWGTRDFLKYYFVTGIGAGLVQTIAAFSLGNPNVPVIGASGAVFGLLIAYGMAFPNRQILLWFVIPVSARVMVFIWGFLELAMIRYPDNVARFAHLGGMLIGFIYLKWDRIGWVLRRLRGQLSGSVRSRRHPRSPEEEEALYRERERILAKISREGMGSLTKEEKDFLDDSAARARARQRGE
jgi:membrane associated rhomboid family serine protease